MILKTVTITGLDEFTDFWHLAELEQEFPFVEWGILYSRSRVGLDLRFPNPVYIEKSLAIKNLKQVAAHLCGEYASAALREKKTAKHFPDCIKRFQINLPQYDYTLINVQPNTWIQNFQKIILQVRNLDERNILTKIYGNYNPEFLFDISGGRGKLANFQEAASWHRNPNQPVGFAGGISPENIDEVLSTLQACLPKDQLVWIDMESGVRNQNNILDLEKVCQVLISCNVWKTENLND